jgi:hypothetical protein
LEEKLIPYNIQKDFIDPANQVIEMNNNPDEYYAKLSNAHIENLKKEVYALHLPTTEDDEQVMYLIEKAFALGCEVGYDNAKTKFTNIFTKFQTALNNEND